MKAVIETGGKQYLVEKGSVIYVEKMDAEPGKKVNFNVLMVGVLPAGRVPGLLHHPLPGQDEDEGKGAGYPLHLHQGRGLHPAHQHAPRLPAAHHQGNARREEELLVRL